MTRKSRRRFTADLKAKVVLGALKERSAIEELARKHELRPAQINTWKKEAVANMPAVFGANKDEGAVGHENQAEKLCAKIGQLETENGFLKKNLWLSPCQDAGP